MPASHRLEDQLRAYASPPTYQVPEKGNLTDDVVNAALERPTAVTFSRSSADGWVDVTTTEFESQVKAVAKGLLAAGVVAGDRVGLLSRTRYEWTLLDYAIWWVGAATVPIYETSSPSQIEWILSDSGAVACIVETREHVGRVQEVRGGIESLSNVWSLDDGAVKALETLGADVDDDTLEERRSSVTPESLATVIYTSGTTGRPKGCCITHSNFMFELGVATLLLDELFETEGASTLLFLPLAHVFARIIQVGCVRSGVRMGHTADVRDLLVHLDDFKPTFILAVPRVFEKVFNGASQKAHADGKGAIFDRAVDTAIAYSRALDGRRVPVLLRARHAIFDRLVYGKLRAALGGRAQYAISGGAPLGERLAHFFRGIGVPVLEGYGLTETTAALAVNLPGETKIGTVGRPIPGTEVKVGEDGELLFRGGQVFSGYWKNDAATADALDDGWFHTGDMGEIDEEGFVRITGRKKEILVTAGGKNVAPAVMEDIIRAHPLVSQCMVVGDGKPFIAALVTLDPEVIEDWAPANGKSPDPAALADDPDVIAQIQTAVDEANAAVSRAESIRKFTILPIDWTEEGGQVTPTLKLKRNVVMREFRDDVESLFD
ncbi:AMP-dependent synthetase/ligase [Nocardioidaceae bacterium SCSIO 66511]|nr:AMP-dependent synthetase/ligase [Nocardioidaceae bacterium SCSIO 66511]